MSENERAIKLLKSEITASKSEIAGNIDNIKIYAKRIRNLRVSIRNLKNINLENEKLVNSLKTSISKLED